MTVYHSELDLCDRVSDESLRQTTEITGRFCSEQ